MKSEKTEGEYDRWEYFIIKQHLKCTGGCTGNSSQGKSRCLYVEVDRLELSSAWGSKGRSSNDNRKNNCLGGLATTGLVTTFAGSSIFR